MEACSLCVLPLEMADSKFFPPSIVGAECQTERMKQRRRFFFSLNGYTRLENERSCSSGTSPSPQGPDQTRGRRSKAGVASFGTVHNDRHGMMPILSVRTIRAVLLDILNETISCVHAMLSPSNQDCGQDLAF